jgi:hypothetical protein
MEAYCVKCNAKKEMRNARVIAVKNGRQATQGTCALCGNKVFKITFQEEPIESPVTTYLER